MAGNLGAHQTLELAATAGKVLLAARSRYIGDARRLRTNRPTIAPSPTAVATLLMDPCRTSPTAKMPGWLVSSSRGVQPSVAFRSDPVTMNPSSSSCRHSFTQSVFGSAPVDENRAHGGRCDLSP